MDVWPHSAVQQRFEHGALSSLLLTLLSKSVQSEEAIREGSKSPQRSDQKMQALE